MVVPPDASSTAAALPVRSLKPRYPAVVISAPAPAIYKNSRRLNPVSAAGCAWAAGLSGETALGCCLPGRDRNVFLFLRAVLPAMPGRLGRY